MAVCVFLALCGPVWAIEVGDPIAHWKLDEGSGTIAYDSAGTNNGTIYGATWTTGQIDAALSFDGINDYVDVGNNSSLKPPLPVTFSAWIKLSSLDRAQIIMTLDNQSYGYYGIWFDVMIPGNKLHISYGDGGSPGPQNRRTKDGMTALSTSTWYHVAAVVRGPVDMDLYVNGVNDGGPYSGTCSSLVYSASGHSFIGGNPGFTSSYFDGTIDDVRVYNRALSAEEVRELYLGRTLVGLEIAGPNEVPDNNSIQYTAMATYDDNSTEDVTLEASWSVDANDIATIDANGVLTTGQLETLEAPILISAEYTEGDVNATAQMEVIIYADCTIAELISRNIIGAIEVKQGILKGINEALEKEARAMRLLMRFATDPSLSSLRRNDFVRVRNNTASAIKKETDGKGGIGQSIGMLQEVQLIIDGDPNSP
jgi:hypothetical protein